MAACSVPAAAPALALCVLAAALAWHADVRSTRLVKLDSPVVRCGKSVLLLATETAPATIAFWSACSAAAKPRGARPRADRRLVNGFSRSAVP